MNDLSELYSIAIPNKPNHELMYLFSLLQEIHDRSIFTIKDSRFEIDNRK